MAAQLSEMTVAQLREAFDVIDHDRSGSIELHEFHAALESIEWSGREELGRIFEEMDTDKSGTIEFDEFLVTAAMAQDLASASQTVAVDLALLLTAYAQRLILERRLNATETPRRHRRCRLAAAPLSSPRAAAAAAAARPLPKTQRVAAAGGGGGGGESGDGGAGGAQDRCGGGARRGRRRWRPPRRRLRARPR